MSNLTLIIPAKNEKESLPTVLDEIKKLNLTCGIKVCLSSDDVETINVGYELAIFQKSQIQVGYGGIGNPNSEEGFTMGGGTSFYAGGFDLRLDYSFRSFGLFGDIHNLSIAILY